MRAVASRLVDARPDTYFAVDPIYGLGQVPLVKKIVLTLLPLLACTAIFIVLSIITFLLFMFSQIAGG